VVVAAGLVAMLVARQAARTRKQKLKQKQKRRVAELHHRENVPYSAAELERDARVVVEMRLTPMQRQPDAAEFII
jgi:hypothetical protein